MAMAPSAPLAAPPTLPQGALQHSWDTPHPFPFSVSLHTQLLLLRTHLLVFSGWGYHICPLPSPPACLPQSTTAIIRVIYSDSWGFPGGSVGEESACNVGDLGSIPGSDPWVSKIPQSRKWQPTLIFLLGEFHGQRSLLGYSPWYDKTQM